MNRGDSTELGALKLKGRAEMRLGQGKARRRI
jgi:hypothetical protein